MSANNEHMPFQGGEKCRENILGSLDMLTWSATYPGLKLNHISSPARMDPKLCPGQIIDDRGVLQPLLHPDDTGIVKNASEQRETEGMSFAEYRIITGNGDVRRVHEYSRIVSGPDKQAAMVTGVIMDITGYKQLEEKEQVQSKEQNYRSLFENDISGVAIHKVIWDQNNNPADYVYLEVNAAFEKHTGLKSADITGKRVTEVIPGIKKAPFIKTYANVVLTGVPVSFAELFEPLQRYYNINAFRVDKDIFATVFQDITEIKGSDQALIDKKAELDDYFTSSLDLLCIGDTKGRFIRLNPEWENVLGYSIEDLESRSFLEFVHPEDLKATKDTISRLIEQKIILNFENRYRCKDGSYRWIEWRSFPKDNLIYAAARDITDHKLAEEKLEKESSILKGLLDSIPDMIFFKDPDGVYMGCNPEFSNFVGRKRKDIIGKTDHDLFGKELADFFRMNDLLMMKEGRARNNEEWVKYPDRRDVLLYTTKAPLKDSAGKTIGLVGVGRDITQSWHAEKKLHEYTDELEKSREQFMLAVNGSQDGIWDWDLRDNSLYLSSRWKEMIGYEDAELINHFSTFEERIHPDDKTRVMRYVEKYLGGEIKDYNIEFRFRHRNGDYIWIMGRGAALRDEYGIPYRMAGSHTDISERKRAEKEILEEHQRLANIIDGTNVGTWEWNVQTGETVFNERWAEIVGYTLEELSPVSIRTWQDMLHPEDREKCDILLQRHFSGEMEYYECEMRMRHKSGEWVWVLERGKVIRWTEDGRPHLMSGTHSDISKRKQMEEKLEEKSSLLQSIISILPGTLNVVDTGYNIIALNNAEFRLKLTDYDCAEELIGKKCYEVFMKRTSPCPWCKASEVMSTGSTMFQSTTPDDIREIRTGKALQVTVSPIRDDLGKIRGVVEYGVDVTSLRNAKLEAEAANKAKSEFLANMSHEIRTPMNGIIGMTSLLLDTELDKDQKHYVQTVQSSGESLLGIINDILDFSKIEADRLELEETEFNLHQLLDSVASLLSLKAHDKGLEFICASSPDTPVYLKGDPGRLKQILTNLAGNAVKFTEKGEIVVRVTLESETDTKAILRFSVKDTGIGIPEEKKALLFNKFSQVDASTTRQYGGTGLGLAISKQLVEMMGGEIGVESDMEKGSEFWFTLDFEKQTTNSDDGKQCYDIHGAHVLVVDDNATNREILVTQLSSWGLNVDEAMDAPLALEKIYRAYEAGIPFQAVLLDMQMPGMDGGSLARVIRSDRNLKDISLIMLSSQGRNPDSWSRYKELFNAHLAKPVMQDQLCQTLACVLNMGTKAENIQFNVKDKDCTTLHRSGLKVLLVEDNIVNQKVAQSMLQKLGICPDIANNGAEAVKMLKDNFYDLVFMDVQMPVMDGLEATRLIRDPVSDVLDHDITIIAMTAHAMKGDKERCYEAGMDDYVSKPVSLKTLAELVGRWSGTIHKKDDAHQGYPAQPEEAMCPDRVIFDRQAFMERIMDDPDLARYLISVFQKDMPQMLQVLKESVEKEQIEDLRHYAHKVKGSSASVGGMALSSIAAEMERIDETEGVKKAGQLMEEIEKQYDLLVLSLKDLIEE